MRDAAPSEQYTPQQRPAQQSRRDGGPDPAPIPVPIRPSIRPTRPHKPRIRVRIRPRRIRIIPIGRAAPAPSVPVRRASGPCDRPAGRLDVHVAAVLVFAEELRFSGLHGADHGLAGGEVGGVGLAFGLFAGAALGLALFVGGIGELVFHFAREAVDARGLVLRVGGGRTRGKFRMAGRVVFFVRGLGGDVFEGDGAVETAVLLALRGGQRAEEVGVVVGVRPDAAGRGGFCVDEELVLFDGVELADPAWGEGPVFVFHGAPVLRGDAVAGGAGGRAVG